MTRDEQLRQASDPSTPAEVLSAIARLGIGEAQQIVAQNPNASPSTLAQLVWRYPNDVLTNPALDLILAEDQGREVKTLLYHVRERAIQPLWERIKGNPRPFYLWLLGQDVCTKEALTAIKGFLWDNGWHPEELWRVVTCPNRNDPIDRMARLAQEFTETVERYLQSEASPRPPQTHTPTENNS